MKMRTRTKIVVVALAMALVMLFVGLFNGIPKTTREVCIRDVNLDEVGTLSYEDKAIQEMESFNNYDFKVSEEDEDILLFNGNRTYSTSEFSDCDFVNLDDSDVDVEYSLKCNKKTTEISGSISYKQDNEIINQDEVNIVKVEYDEVDGSANIYFEDGSVVNSLDLLDGETVDDCSFAAAAAGIGTVLVKVVVVVLVVVVVIKVLSWFFPWLSRKIEQRRYEQRTQYQTTTVLTPALIIDGIRFETKVKSKAEVEALPRYNPNNEPIYYLAFTSGISSVNGKTDTVISNDGLYIGGELTFEQAIEALTTDKVTEVERDDVTYTYIPSVYTYYESDIMKVMNEVGYHSETPAYKPEWECNSVKGLPHYHPSDIYDLQVKKGKGTKTYRHHAFFINFDMTTWMQYQYA